MDKHESKYFNTASRMDEALLTLLKKKDFEYITVKEVCEEAKVNRSTFYLHYENTIDVLEEVLSNLSSSFAKHFESVGKASLDIPRANLEELYFLRNKFLIPYLEFIKENKMVYKAIRGNPSLFRAKSTYERMFKDIFTPILIRFGLEERWHKYLTDYYMSGLSSIILDWVRDECTIPISELADFIQGIVERKGMDSQENK